MQRSGNTLIQLGALPDWVRPPCKSRIVKVDKERVQADVGMGFRKGRIY
jgi:hypothetical protein